MSYDHEARVREVMIRQISIMPLKKLLTLQELAWALNSNLDPKFVLMRTEALSGRKDPVKDAIMRQDKLETILADIAAGQADIDRKIAKSHRKRRAKSAAGDTVLQLMAEYEAELIADGSLEA